MKMWYPAMTIAVDLGHKATKQTNNFSKDHQCQNVCEGYQLRQQAKS